MLGPRRVRTPPIGPAGDPPLALAAALPSRKRAADRRGRPKRPGLTGLTSVLLGLCLLLLPVSGFGLYVLHRQASLHREMSAMREQLEGRIQKLDAGIHFDSKRRQLLLRIRDEIMAAHKKLGPDRAYDYATHLLTACEKYPAIDPLLLLAIGIAESGFDTMATSSARARGLYQILPSTGRMLAGMLGWEYTDGLLHDPGKNTALAALYLHILFTAYNDERLVLAEYNGGPLNAGYIRAGGSRASPETRSYVAKVVRLHERLKAKVEFGEGIAPGRDERTTLPGGGPIVGPSLPVATAATR